VPRGGDRRLDDEEVGAGLLGQLREPEGPLRDGRDDDRRAPLLDLTDAPVDELLLDGLAVDRLDDPRGFLGRGRDDLLDHLVGGLVARLDALQVEDGQPAEAAHLRREACVGDAVHRRRDDRELDASAAKLPGDVDLVRVDRDGARDQRDVVEAIRDPSLAPAAYPHAHAGSPPSRPTGSDRVQRPPLDIGRV
jgi:hypothetical protein